MMLLFSLPGAYWGTNFGANKYFLALFSSVWLACGFTSKEPISTRTLSVAGFQHYNPFFGCMKQKNDNRQQQEQTDNKNDLPNAQYISVRLKFVVAAGWLLPCTRRAHNHCSRLRPRVKPHPETSLSGSSYILYLENTLWTQQSAKLCSLWIHRRADLVLHIPPPVQEGASCCWFSPSRKKDLGLLHMGPFASFRVFIAIIRCTESRAKPTILFYVLKEVNNI